MAVGARSWIARTWGVAVLRSLAIGLGLAVASAAPALAGAPLSDWAAVVVAGDDRAAHEDTFTEAFDNARRDVALAWERAGLDPRHIAQFSVRPNLYPNETLRLSNIETIQARLGALAQAHRGGCLVYLTSHGSPDGVVVSDQLITPRRLEGLVETACGAAPTAVIVSACFSGIMLPTLARPNRFVLTAARRDRSSFGCGESDRYPFFDGCVIEDLPRSRDFLDLAARVRRCVALREDQEGMRPRSQPQLFVGGAFRRDAPTFASGG